MSLTVALDHCLLTLPSSFFLSSPPFIFPSPRILSHGLKGSSTTPTKATSGADSTLISYSDLISRSQAKIPLTSQFLVELVNSVYFCMYNDLAAEGLQALEEIHTKATYNLYTDVLLVSYYPLSSPAPFTTRAV